MLDNKTFRDALGDGDAFFVILQAREYLVWQAVKHTDESHPLLLLVLEAHHIALQHLGPALHDGWDDASTERTLRFQELLLPKGGKQVFGHCLVVLACIADVREDLCQRLLLVDFHEVPVYSQRLAFLVASINTFRCKGGVGLLVHDGLEGQAVCLSGLFRRPANGQRGNGKDEFGQLESRDDGLRLIDSRAKETNAEAFLLCQAAKRLGEEQGIGSGIEEAQDIVVAGTGLTLQAPVGCPAEVGTNGQQDRSLRHHWLEEVCGSQLLLHFCRPRDHDAVKLQVAHCLRA